MARYRVGFDRKWQGGLIWTKLVAVFPEDRAREGRIAWSYRGDPSASPFD